MSSLQTLKQFVNDRLVAAAEEIFGVFQQTVSELENELNRQREQLDVFLKQPVLHLQTKDSKEVTKQEDSPEQECRPGLNLEEPEPPNNASEKQEKPAFVQVKSEDEVQRDEEPSTSSLVRHKIEAGGDNCGGSELYALYHSYQQRPLSSECDTDDSEDWRDTSEIKQDTNCVEVPKAHVSEKNADAESLKCSECGIIFSSRSGLTLHFCKLLTCLVCQQCFETRLGLENHMRIHTNVKNVNCPHCGKYFTRSGDLKVHIRRVHTGEKPFNCTHCGKCFTQSGQLKVHIRIHTGEKPYICSYCGKSFAQSGDLKVHVRIHTGEKPYICTHCGKCFKQSVKLKVHMRIHTGEKPFSCSLCGKCFITKGNLMEHVKIHTGEKPFGCSFCGKCFTQKATLQNHIKIHTR